MKRGQPSLKISHRYIGAVRRRPAHDAKPHAGKKNKVFSPIGIDRACY
jgi:hypothetical protein